MNRKSDSPPSHPLFRGALRGAAGAMAMSGMRQAAVGLGAIQRTPPAAILKEGVPAILHSIPENRRMAAIELAHWGYGATAGAIFTLLPSRLRRSWLTGPVYGMVVWGSFELALAPVLGLAHARKSRPRERWALLIDHVFFGFVLGEPFEAVVAGTDEPENQSRTDESRKDESRKTGSRKAESGRHRS